MFVTDWKKSLGYRKDPFSKELEQKVPMKDLIVGFTKERELLNLFIIKEESVALIEGVKGSGKSALARWLYEELRPRFRTFLITDEKVIKGKKLFSYLLDQLVSPVEDLFRKVSEMSDEEKEALLLRKLGKGRTILIIDSGDKLSEHNKEVIKALVKEVPLSVVVTVSVDKGDKGKKAVLLDDKRLVDRKIKIGSLSVSESSDLLVKRIMKAGGDGRFPFTDHDVKALHKRAEGNPERFLKECRELAITLSLKPEELSRREETRLVRPSDDQIVGGDGSSVIKKKSVVDRRRGRGWGFRFERDEYGRPILVFEKKKSLASVKSTNNTKSNGVVGGGSGSDSVVVAEDSVLDNDSSDPGAIKPEEIEELLKSIKEEEFND